MKFDSASVERMLVKSTGKSFNQGLNPAIVQAIKAIDRHYRVIVDTLYPSFKSSRYTILQPVRIETDGGGMIDPGLLADKMDFSSILFESAELNLRVKAIVRNLPVAQHESLFAYLGRTFTNFSMEDTALRAQPVRIRYIRFPDANFTHIGLDIYGAHFLWVVDMKKHWDIVRVAQLWTY